MSNIHLRSQRLFRAGRIMVLALAAVLLVIAPRFSAAADKKATVPLVVTITAKGEVQIGSSTYSSSSPKELKKGIHTAVERLRKELRKDPTARLEAHGILRPDNDTTWADVNAVLGLLRAAGLHPLKLGDAKDAPGARGLQLSLVAPKKDRGPKVLPPSDDLTIPFHLAVSIGSLPEGPIEGEISNLLVEVRAGTQGLENVAELAKHLKKVRARVPKDEAVEISIYPAAPLKWKALAEVIDVCEKAGFKGLGAKAGFKDLVLAPPREELDLTSTDIGIDDTAKMKYDLDRIEEVSVPGILDPTAPVGIIDAPEAAVRTHVPLPPGVAGGTGAAPLVGEGPAIGGVAGTLGGMGDPLVIGSFNGRSGATREKIENFGGNKLSEAAVARGLQWLALHQSQEGRWGLHDFNRCAREKPFPAGDTTTCTCDGAAPRRNDVAATGLALLPFLGAGITHKNSNGKFMPVDYTKTVEAGLFWLVKKQAADGSFNSDMYSHGIATIAMCEAYGLNSDPRLKVSAQKAINFIVAAQDVAGGGWRYAPKQAGDTSVTGWQLTALKSAQMSGLSVPRKALTLCEQYLDSVEDRGNKGRYKYTPDGTPTPAMSSVALLCRQYLGVNPRNPGLINGCDYLLESARPGTSNNIYYEYYATQVFHHMGGDSWQRWNEGKAGAVGIRDYLIRRQDHNKGPKKHIDGSFPATDVFGGQGGRIMTTALSVLCLEVYYRHLPLYRRNFGVEGLPGR